MTHPQSNSTPNTLLGLLGAAPDDRTALIQPDLNVRLTYGALRQQVEAVASALAAAGVGRGDRVGMALPNGVANIVTFLAASVAGTAAPLLPRGHQRQGVAPAARRRGRGAACR
jgi:acyl-CoA synthetase (AMP-forming)/AMP-acid ligase II